jgi:hypothetical protein
LGNTKKRRLNKREIALSAALVLLICYVLMRSYLLFTGLSFYCITKGMSPTLVSIIMGGPPGDYRSGPTRIPDDSRGGIGQFWAPANQCHSERWDTDTGLLIVTFGDKEGATQKYFERRARVPQTFMENLHWRWERWDRAMHPVLE